MLLHETLVIADIHFRFILECSTNDNERYSSFIKCKKKDLALAKGVCFANLAKASDPIEWKVTCRALRTLGFEERNIWFEASIQFTAVQKYNQVIPESLIPVLIHLWLKLSREFQNGYPQELLYSDGFETIAELWKDPREKLKVWQEWYKDEMFRYWSVDLISRHKKPSLNSSVVSVQKVRLAILYFTGCQRPDWPTQPWFSM